MEWGLAKISCGKQIMLPTLNTTEMLGDIGQTTVTISQVLKLWLSKKNIEVKPRIYSLSERKTEMEYQFHRTAGSDRPSDRNSPACMLIPFQYAFLIFSCSFSVFVFSLPCIVTVAAVKSRDMLPIVWKSLPDRAHFCRTATRAGKLKFRCSSAYCFFLLII